MQIFKRGSRIGMALLLAGVVGCAGTATTADNPPANRADTPTNKPANPGVNTPANNQPSTDSNAPATNANPTAGNRNAGSSGPSAPAAPTWKIQATPRSTPQAPEWQLVGAKPAVTVRVEFADTGHSIADGIPDDLRQSGIVAMRESLSRHIFDEFRRIREWVAAHGNTPQIDRLVVQFVEDPATLAVTGDGGWQTIRVPFDAVISGALAREIYSRVLGPDAPGLFVIGLAELALHRMPTTATEADLIARLFGWMWATKLGLFANAVPAAEPLAFPLPAPLPMPAVAPLECWQIADFVAFLIFQHGAGSILAACRPEGADSFRLAVEGYREQWLTDRRASGVAEPEAKALATLKFLTGDVAGALAAMPAKLTGLSLQNIHPQLLLHGFGELAFLAGRYDFCNMWLTEGLLSAEFNDQLLGRPAAAIAPVFVPMREIPWPAAAGAIFLDARSAELAASIVLRAGRRDLALLVRSGRGLIDAPSDATMRERLDRWGQLPPFSPAIADFVRALTLRAANQHSAAADAANQLAPGKFRTAWEHTAK